MQVEIGRINSKEYKCVQHRDRFHDITIVKSEEVIERCGYNIMLALKEDGGYVGYCEGCYTKHKVTFITMMGGWVKVVDGWVKPSESEDCISYFQSELTQEEKVDLDMFKKSKRRQEYLKELLEKKNKF